MKVTRFTPHRGLLLLLAAFLTAAPHTTARAGPVQLISGLLDGEYFLENQGTDSDRAAIDLDFPGRGSLHYSGTTRASDLPGSGDHRGDTGGTYALQDFEDGAKFDVTVFHQNVGASQQITSGDASFVLNFTTDRALDYVWTVDPTGPAAVIGSTLSDSSLFSDNSLELYEDEMGNFSGSLLDESGKPAAKTLKGVLAPGQNGFVLCVS